MAQLIVPALDEDPWPTLGPQVCDHIEERAIFGPGDLKGQPAVLSPEKRAIVYRAYEVYPQGHVLAGRRRFKRVGWSVRKGLAKTELLAWIAYCELHPEAPVRCDGFDSRGEPVGRPQASPYIPLLAYTKDQTEELAYGALYTVVTEGPDADLFDAGQDRIIRLDDRGRDDGKAVPLAGSPNAADGARTTFQGFDEPHRLYLPRLHEAHETMTNNLPKRPAADAWSFYVGTAGELGQGSIAENLYKEAEDIAAGKIKDPRIFFFHRDAGRVHRGEKDGTGHDLTKHAERIAAITEATGPDGEYGPGQFSDIAEVYDRPKTDKSYWERVWLNLWLQSGRQAFDPGRAEELRRDALIAPGALVTVGFDGARFRDSTAIVVTELATGLQQLWGLWERPPRQDDQVEADDWQVDPLEVSTSVETLMRTFDVWRFNGDPPHWVEQMADWSGTWPVVEEWWTNRVKPMAYACRNYAEAMRTGAVTYARDDRPALNSPVEDETQGSALLRHIAAAGRHQVNLFDDEGERLWILDKIHADRRFDACMAAILSWEGFIAARSGGAMQTQRRGRVVRRMR